MTPSEEVYSLVPMSNCDLWAVAPIDLWQKFMGYRWRVKKPQANSGIYAYRMGYDEDGTRIDIPMHREVMGCSPRDGLIVDHINHDTLDNRRNNLRIVTQAQNMYNKRGNRSSKSGYKGVYPYRDRWAARICVEGKILQLGIFDLPEAAHAAYCEAARKHFGEYACFI